MDMLEDRFNLLRITVEAMSEPRAVLMIGGGCERDGADVVALGLARAFAGTGARVGLISADVAHRSDRAEIAAVPLMSVQGLSSVRLSEKFAKLCAEFDVVLFAIPALFERSFEAELARRCDGVVLTIELGRRIAARDKEIAATLERLAVRCFGVVTTKPDLRRRSSTVAAESGRRSALVRKPSTQRV